MNRCDRAWIEIDAEALRRNYQRLCAFVAPMSCICVVKADGYGHDAVQESLLLQAEGAMQFAVASAEEAVALRNGGVHGDILILGHTVPSQMDALHRYNLIQTIGDPAYGRSLATYAKTHGQVIRVHWKVDTGMHRLGIRMDTRWEELQELAASEDLRLEGCFSHFCCADSFAETDVAFSHRQIDRFQTWLEEAKVHGIEVGLTHMAASAAIVNYPGLPFDACRPGILLLGFDSGEMKHPYRREAVLSLHARIVKLDRLMPQESIGYGRTYTASSERWIATVSIGYGDGVPRCYRKGEVLIDGVRCPMVGRISMDQLCVDVTALKDRVALFDDVVLLGSQQDERITMEEMADKAGTISNEIATKLTKRLPRIYR